MRLGIRQLEMLRACGPNFKIVVGCKMVRRLIDLGLMESDNPEGNWSSVTANGLRAVADAMDAGKFSKTPTSPFRNKRGQR